MCHQLLDFRNEALKERIAEKQEYILTGFESLKK